MTKRVITLTVKFPIEMIEEAKNEFGELYDKYSDETGEMKKGMRLIMS